jgi:DNA topoisomerase IB
VPATGLSLVMNPKYDPKQDNAYVFEVRQQSGGRTPYYTMEYKSRKREAKYEKVTMLAKKIKGVVGKWRKELLSKNETRAMLSTILELSYTTLARIGKVGNATGGQSTTGISTLQVKHLKFAPDRIVFSFIGKAGVPFKTTITKKDIISKAVYANLQRFCEGKDKAAYVFCAAGEDLPLTNVQINSYLKRLGAPTTIKAFRTLKGTAAARTVLDSLEMPKGVSQSEAEKIYKKAMEKVGELLNHKTGIGTTEKVTGTTAIQSYIDPQLQIQFFEDLGLRTPTFLEKLK